MLRSQKIRIPEVDENKKNELELASHHAEADKAYEEKRRVKNLAVGDESKRCYVFDLQQCLQTPMFNISVVSYKRQLWTFNLTLHESSGGQVRCYVWHKAKGGRGGNQIATCRFKELTSIPSQVSHVILYSHMWRAK